MLTKSLGNREAKKYIGLILSLFEIAPVNRHVLDSALKNTNFNDFEDAVLHESAVNVQIDFIVTRNIKDFKYSKIPVYEPQDLIKLLKNL